MTTTCDKEDAGMQVYLGNCAVQPENMAGLRRAIVSEVDDPKKKIKKIK